MKYNYRKNALKNFCALSSPNKLNRLQKILKLSGRDRPIFEPGIYEQYSGYDDFYPDIEDEKIEYEENLDNIYCGNKVCWIGDAGKMMKVNSNYIYSIHGNQFYPLLNLQKQTHTNLHFLIHILLSSVQRTIQ